MSFFIDDKRPTRSMLCMPRMISTESLTGKKGDGEKIVAKKVEKMSTAASKLTKKQQAIKDAKDAVVGVIGKLVSDKPTKEKIRAYLEERIKGLNAD